MITDIALDTQQLQMVGMYEQILNDDNIRQYFEGRGRSGYLTGVVYKNGTAQTLFFDTQRHTGYTVQQLFEGNFVYDVRTMLKDWHTKKVYTYRLNHFSYTEQPKSVTIDLTHKQRGILTKILKIQNKRKKLLKGETN